ncbi:MAG: phosphohistidine phosphatase SixA [Candidatus Omnitrophota bacterium]
MKIYITRHGEAFAGEENPEQPLTDQGRQDTLKVAYFLKSINANINIIYSSTKNRALQTAQIFSEELWPKEGSFERKDLGPNDPVENICLELNAQDKDVMIVGHLPFVSRLASRLLTGQEMDTWLSFKPSGVVCLEKTPFGDWQLIFIVMPEIFKK